MSISESGMLTIRGAVPEDAGNYTCLATNEAGTASQSVTVSYAGAGVSGSVDGNYCA